MEQSLEKMSDEQVENALQSLDSYFSGHGFEEIARRMKSDDKMVRILR